MSITPPPSSLGLKISGVDIHCFIIPCFLLLFVTWFVITPHNKQWFRRVWVSEENLTIRATSCIFVHLVLYRPVCITHFPFPELRNYCTFWLEIFTSDRSWPSETMCKSRPPACLAFYRPVSISPKMLTISITTGPISLKFWEQASINNIYHWSKFQVNSIFQSWDIKI